MSHDPERLLHLRAPGDELERELLASIQQAGPPAHAKDEAWLAIAGRIAALGAAAGTAATAGTASTATAAASTATAAASNAAASATSATAGTGAAAAATTGLGAIATSAIATKAAWTLAAGTLALGGYLAVQHARSEPSSPAHSETAVPSAPLRGGGFQTRPLAPTPPRIEPAAQGTATAAAEPPASTPAAAAAAAPATRREVKPTPAQLDRLSAESALLAAARAQLRSGDARAAHATLARLRARFPRGVLVQEREVLAIELLAAQGRGAAAARRASSFVRAYPQSPHSAKLTRFLDAP